MNFSILLLMSGRKLQLNAHLSRGHATSLLSLDVVFVVRLNAVFFLNHMLTL